jgi:hypothetical protein
VAKILQIENIGDSEGDQMALIDKICDRFQRLESKKNNAFDSAKRSDSLSADRNAQ